MHRTTKQIGDLGEKIAVEYLSKKGFEIVEKQFRVGRFEIDIIARERHTNTLVFVEVKTRKSIKFGYPEESVSEKKKNNLIEASTAYLEENRQFNCIVRFDVISIILSRPLSITHFEDAFGVNY